MLDDQNNPLWLSRVKDIYVQSASNLENAYNELLLHDVEGPHLDYLQVKFMASLIHNDVCREVLHLHINPTTGASKLLSISQVILKLFKAYLWYSKTGNKKLRELAESRGRKDFIQAQFNVMKTLCPSRIEKYADIRNELSAHYLEQSSNVLQRLGTIEADTFFKDLEMTIRYQQEWLKALRSVGKIEIPQEGL